MVEFQPFLTQEIELGCEHGFFQFSRKQVNVLRKKNFTEFVYILGPTFVQKKSEN